MRERAWRSGQGRARKLRDARQYRPLHGCDRQEHPTCRSSASPWRRVTLYRSLSAWVRGGYFESINGNRADWSRLRSIRAAPGDLTTAVPVTVGRARIELSDLLFVIKASKLVLNRIAAAVGRYRRAWYRLSEQPHFPNGLLETAMEWRPERGVVRRHAIRSAAVALSLFNKERMSLV